MAWDTYAGATVFVYQDSGEVQEFVIPFMGISREIINNYRIVGQSWQTRNKDTIKDTQYQLTSEYNLRSGQEKNLLMAFWVDRVRQIHGSGNNKFWLPSWKKDYQAKSIGSTTEINIWKSYTDENNSSLVRHLAIFKTGDLSVPPDYRKVSSFTNVDSTTDKITINSALSGMTTDIIIMNLFFVSFFNDLFPIKIKALNEMGVNLSFIEDQRTLS